MSRYVRMKREDYEKLVRDAREAERAVAALTADVERLRAAHAAHAALDERLLRVLPAVVERQIG